MGYKCFLFKFMSHYVRTQNKKTKNQCLAKQHIAKTETESLLNMQRLA